MVDYILIGEIVGLITFGALIMAIGVCIGNKLTKPDDLIRHVDVPVQQTTHDEEYTTE
jgi:hypothetical protein